MVAIVGRVVLEITIREKQVLGRIVSQVEVRGENHITYVTTLYTWTLQKEAFSAIVKVEEHKGTSGVSEGGSCARKTKDQNSKGIQNYRRY